MFIKLNATETRLFEFMSGLDLIDAHEHLPPERIRTDRKQDVFTLFSQYLRHDLFSAGMDRETYLSHRMDISSGAKRPLYDRLMEAEAPLEERWRAFRPYWDSIRHGSYARAARLTAKLVYGVNDISDDTYQVLSERIAAENTPGIYRRMLCDRCRIRASLSIMGETNAELPLIPVLWATPLFAIASRQQVEQSAGDVGEAVPPTLDDYLGFMRRRMETWVAEGVVGIKMMLRHYPAITRADADCAYRRLMDAGTIEGEVATNLAVYLLHAIIDQAAALRLTIAVHAGIWGDFREIDSKHMLTLAPAHPAAEFDLFHLGMPSVRDTLVVAKNIPNVNLNLCWTHILSPSQACSGIDEMIDQVPVNKVLAFGGDYGRPVEKVVGHLHMAKENLARVFAARIDRGLMGFEDATAILQAWFWDNAFRIYPRLDGRINKTAGPY